MQKKIIIPTDFSDVAIMVEQTALSLATRMGAEAIFVSCVKGENPGEFFDGEDGNVPYFLKDEFNAFKERRKISDPSHRLLFTHDTLPEAIHQLKATEDIALIVMGSSGTHGLKQLWGSNAQKVGRIAACPVLVIKQDTSPTFFSQIMFASNFRHEAKQAFENFVSFAKLFGSHIHLVYVTTLKTDMVENKLASQKMQAFRQMCGGFTGQPAHVWRCKYLIRDRAFCE